MGIDAIATVWVGFNLDKKGFDWDSVADKLPDGFLDLVEEEDEKAHGIQYIDCSESRAGFGIVIFRHDWDYGVAEFSLSELTTKEREARDTLRNLFTEWGIDEPIGTWVQTDMF